MTYTSGGSVQAQDYNTFSSNTNAVWNTLYGQTAVATVAVGNIVYANNWATLNSTISNMAAHQGTTITTRTGPTPGQTISVQSNIATDITSCTTNEYNAASLGSQYTGWTGNASATSGAGTGGTWTITFTDTVTFASAASANYFFNCGGLIKIQFGKSSTGSAGDSEWNNFISNVVGAIYLSGTAAGKTINGTTYTGTTKIGGTGTPTVLATGTGFAQLSSTPTTIYTQTDPSLTSSQISVSAAYNGSTTLTFVTTWTSGSTNAISGGTATTGTAFGTAPATVVTYFPPETTYLTNTWGTPTVASSFGFVNNASPAPTITGVSTSSGYTTGGTNITISGTNFYNVTSVTVGGSAVTNLVVVSTTSITATTPAGSAGSATVTVTTSTGTANDSGGFTYITPPPTITGVSPSSGYTTSGTAITISGTNFVNVTSVTVSGTSASYTVNSPTSITATTPTGSAGSATVTVTTSTGTANDSGGFTYVTPPTPAGTLLSTYCSGYNLYGTYADGNYGTYNALIAANSASCGYVAGSHLANAAGFNGNQGDDGMAFSLDHYPGTGTLTLNIAYWSQWSNGTELEYGANGNGGEQFALQLTTSGQIVFGTSANAVSLRQVYGGGDYIYTYWNAGTFTQTYASGATESVAWPTARVAARWNGGNSVTIFLNNSYRNSGDTGTNYAFTEGQYSFGTGWAGTYYVPPVGYTPASSGPYTAYNITW